MRGSPGPAGRLPATADAGLTAPDACYTPPAMAAAAPMRIALRPMARSDLRQVRRIERAAYQDAWPRTTFEQELRNGLAHYFVALELPPEDAAPSGPPRGALATLRRLLGLGGAGDRVLGFAGVWFTADQLHLVTIAVAPDFQRRGVARRMLLHCFALAEDAAARTIALEVRPSNQHAIRLYELFGFRRAGRRARYYANNGEDALVMVTPDGDERDFRQHAQQLRAQHRRRYGDTFSYLDDPSPAAAPVTRAGD